MQKSPSKLIFPGILKLGLPALLAVAIAGCGGSGGDETDPQTNADATTPPPAPTLSLTPEAIKTFQFSWDDVAGETEYTLYEDSTGNAGYTEIASIAAD